MNTGMTHDFKRDEHVYVNKAFSRFLKDAVRFFHGTPVLPLPLKESFDGAGVYAIYCVANRGLYGTFGKTLNASSYNVPIYVGKAVPSGWRQSRIVGQPSGAALFSRLAQHSASIEVGAGLRLADFACRFVILENEMSDMIAAMEAAIIAEYTPLWNSVIDGFGNHDPGKRRLTGKRPQWDCLHPGRPWALRMQGEAFDVAALRRRVTDYFMGMQCRR